MKNLLLPVLAASALLLGACSSQKLAQDSSDDDVYFTSAKAKEIPVPVATNSQPQKEKSYKTDEQLYGGGNYTDQDYYDDYNYDYGYASRLNRFYGRSPWRSAYYDSWYSYGYYPWYTYRYDPFFYDPWYYSPGTSIWVGIGSYPRYGWYDNYYWRYYGSYYNSPYWGPYSYNNVYPGYYGGRYSAPNKRRPNYTDPNYNGRSNGNVYNNGPRTIGTDRNGRVISGTSRGERWDNENQRTSSSPSRGTGRVSESPSRGERPSGCSNSDYGTSRSARPQRSEPVYQPSPSTQSSSPSRGGSSDGGGGNSGGGGSSRSARPSRGGN